MQVKADVEKRVSDVLQRTRELELQLEQARSERRQVQGNCALDSFPEL